MSIDIRTILLLNFFIDFISVGALAIIWVQYRKRFAGISFWLINWILHTFSIGFILLRGILPGFITIMVANILILTGELFILHGLERFLGKKKFNWINYFLMVIFFIVFYYYFAIKPDITMREIIFSIMTILISTQISWVLLWKPSASLRGITRITGFVMIGNVITGLLRIIMLTYSPIKNSDLFQTAFANGFALTAYILLQICCIIALILMVTNHLLNDVQAQEIKFTKAFHSSPNAILLSKPSTGEIFDVNDGFVRITGYQPAEAVGKSTLDLHLWAREEDRAAAIKEVSNNKIQGKEILVRKKSGEMMTGLFSVDIIEINDEKFLLSNISDITELSQIKQQLQEMATHDGLTGLPNRRLFYDRFEIALANAQRTQHGLAIISMDLDNFKTINDRFGHLVGDQVLIESGKRLKDSLRKVDTVARFGGDEFILLVWEISTPNDVIRIAEKILKKFHNPFIIDDFELFLTVSLGIALFPEDGTDIQTLIRKSDEAMYAVKEKGRDNYQLFL